MKNCKEATEKAHRTYKLTKSISELVELELGLDFFEDGLKVPNHLIKKHINEATNPPICIEKQILNTLTETIIGN
jgi:hypothetical protein